MIKKVLALAVALQLTLPLQLLAQSTQSQAPTAQDVEMMLALPNLAIKNYKKGILIGTGVGAAAVYIAYTSKRIANLSAANKDLSKTITGLSADIKSLAERVTATEGFPTAAAKDIGALDAKVNQQAKTLQTQGTKIGNMQVKVAEHSRVIAGQQKVMTRVVGTQNQIAGAVSAQGEAVEEIYKVLENHAQAINGNSAGVNQIVETLEQVAPAANDPRRPIGYRAYDNTTKTTAKQVEKAVHQTTEALTKGQTAKAHKYIKRVADVLKKSGTKVTIVVAAAAILAFSLVPEEAEAAGISNSRALYTRALRTAQAENPDLFAITALNLAEYNKGLVASIIAESTDKDGFYPLLKSQIEEMTSPENMKLVETMTAAGSNAQYNRNNIVQQLQQSDFRNFAPVPFAGFSR